MNVLWPIDLIDQVATWLGASHIVLYGVLVQVFPKLGVWCFFVIFAYMGKAKTTEDIKKY